MNVPRIIDNVADTKLQTDTYEWAAPILQMPGETPFPTAQYDLLTGWTAASSNLGNTAAAS